MAADWQAQVPLGEAWFVAFPASRAAAERWVAEVAHRYGWDAAPVRDEALLEIAARRWIPHVLAEVAKAQGEERVREMLSWVEEAAVTYGASARWLSSIAAEDVLWSELRDRLPKCAGWERDVVAIYKEAEAGGEHLDER